MVSPTAAVDPANVTIEVGVRPMGQKAAKRAKREQDEDSESAPHAERKVVIDRGQDLLEKLVQAQEEANWLTAEMLQLEGRIQQRQGILDDVKVLATDLSAFDEESKAIFAAMKKILAGRYLEACL